jgi:hypothetical protein
VLHPGHAADLSGHHPPVVEEEHEGLVALGPEGLDDHPLGAGGGRPVDPAVVVVGRVLAQLVEVGAPAPAPRRPEADLEDPGPLDAQLGLLATAERRVDP